MSRCRWYGDGVLIEDGIDCGPSMTKQYFKDECDINLIVKKGISNGFVGHTYQGEPRYGDFDDVPSYQESCDMLLAAERGIEGLPPKAFERFGGNVQALLDFVADPRNREEAVRMGLVAEKGNLPQVEPSRPLNTVPGSPVKPDAQMNLEDAGMRGASGVGGSAPGTVFSNAQR